ncbi:MAG: PTS lactose/cellobiose transporter subunit IIA [Lentilactobacillus diolivorans]|jgi:PTS system cellobiose-specific IIA component|uniref:PTS lactose/cellobiose transporter subunit IIA n=1 Tax=Lentilactobacillus diolivorans TaxID=179838 RepID=UPI000FF058FE|nr:MAG: PTS lactose/cellobiose transporter subunit IIA [Lactobacillus sp.]
MNLDELNESSMKILTYSGKAKKVLTGVLDKLSTNHPDKESIHDQLLSADHWLKKAHQEQNKVIANVETLQYSVLFTHAQDTLMNTETVQFLVRRFIPIYFNKH